jgi:hypothetical protein
VREIYRIPAFFFNMLQLLLILDQKIGEQESPSEEIKKSEYNKTSVYDFTAVISSPLCEQLQRCQHLSHYNHRALSGFHGKKQRDAGDVAPS